MIVKDINDIKEVIKDLIQIRNASYSDHVTKPSKIWSQWLSMLSFVTELSEDSLEKIRLHTGFGFFLGSNWSTCYYEKNEIEIGLKNSGDSKYINDYIQLTKGIPEKFHCSEIDKNRELISIQYNGKYINEDVLRFQSTISNLSNLKERKIKRYLEIGAGYGGLCNQFSKIFRPEQSIVIDHPEVLFWSAVYTFVNNPTASIEIVTSEDTIISESDFVFVPAFLTDVLKDEKVDLLVNENSFCEMMEEQVEYYLKTLSYGLLYSNNRNRQFMNFEIANLNDILLSSFNTTPSSSFYKTIYNAHTSEHNLKYCFFAAKDTMLLPSIIPEKLCGLSVRESF